MQLDIGYMQVCKYTSMQVCKHAIMQLKVKKASFTKVAELGVQFENV